jgi:hypothetical protein
MIGEGIMSGDSTDFDTTDALTQAVADRLQKMVNQSCIWPDQSEDLEMAMMALGIDVFAVCDPHPALGLFLELLSDLHKAAEKDTLVYLNAEQKRWIEKAIHKMDDLRV